MRRHVVGLVLGIFTFSICVGSVWLWRELTLPYSEVPAHIETPAEPVSLREINSLANAPQPADNYFAKFHGIMVTEGWNEKKYLDLPKIKKQKDWIALYDTRPGKIELRRVQITIDERPIDDETGKVDTDYVNIMVVGHDPNDQEYATYLFANIEELKVGEPEIASPDGKHDFIGLTYRYGNDPDDIFFDLGDKNYWIKKQFVFGGKDNADLTKATAFLSDGLTSQYLVNTDQLDNKVWNANASYLGDLDGDRKVDMIVAVSQENFEEVYSVLMLSSAAGPGRLLAPVASHRHMMDGC